MTSWMKPAMAMRRADAVIVSRIFRASFVDLTVSRVTMPSIAYSISLTR
jgi:hypothetical protein